MTLRLPRLLTVTALALVLGVAPLAWATPVQPGPSPAPASFADMAQNLLPAVVNIATTQEISESPISRDMFPQLPPGSPFEDMFRDFFERNFPEGNAPITRRATSLGSGFIIDPAGFIVTNNHVIADADEIKVIFNDKTELDAKVVGRDAKMDLALLKVEAKKQLPYVQWGDSDAARVGDWVLAIGNPFGLGGTVTQGIVSARARNINAGPYDDFIQTDAAINRGNSGGPMFNMAGQVIGVNTAIFSPSGGSVGIGFSIPSNLVRPTIEQLKQYGKPRRGWLGVKIQEVTPEIAESLGLRAPMGALVAGVEPNTPAAGAGILPGDVILNFNNRPVTEMRQLPRIVADTKINSEVPVVILRNGREQRVEVKVAEMVAEQDDRAKEKHQGETRGPAILGMRLAELDVPTRARLNLPADLKAVLITGVEGDSDAADKGLRPGDLILAVNQQAVVTPGEVTRQVEQARRNNRRSVLVLVQGRTGDRTYLALPVAAGKPQKAPE